MEISPAPDLYEVHTDFFGKSHSHYVEIHPAYPTSGAQVRHLGRPVAGRRSAEHDHPVDRTVELVHLDPRIDPVKRASYLLPSPLIELSTPVREFASGLLDPRMPVGEAIRHGLPRDLRRLQLHPRCHDSSHHAARSDQCPGGVCRDFAHLAVASFRAVEHPARYISGYIQPIRHPGELAGSDATHAWASVTTFPNAAGSTWTRPTINWLIRYLVTAWGRDFRDVIHPLKGVIFSESRDSVLDVAVDVTRLD